jgi:hypothetical protein
MSTSLNLLNSEVFRAALNAAGIGRTVGNLSAAEEADLRAIVRAGLRRFFFPLSNGQPYQWRWLERFHTISAPDSYTTGTVTISAGVITLAGGTWPSWAANGFMSVDGHIVFVETRTSDTLLATNHTELTVAAGTTYELFQYRFDLPTDFAEWTGAVTYANSADYWILAAASETELRLRYSANYNYDARTSHYAVTPAQDGTFRLMLWPVPQTSAEIRGVYIMAPQDNLTSDLTTDPGTTVQCPPAYADAAMEAILAAAEAYNDDAIGIHEQRFQTAIAAAIAHDRSTVDGIDFSRQIGRRRIPPFPTAIGFDEI